MVAGLVIIGVVALIAVLRSPTQPVPESQQVPLLDTEAEGPFDYTHWANVLDERVDELGMVDYAGVKAEPQEFDAFMDQLAEYSPEHNAAMFTTEEEALAYWINAYNAWTMRIVADNYPVESIMEIGEKEGAAFDQQVCKLGGETMSLNDIEQGIVRKRFVEPRAHFALNCASLGCPPLPKEPFLPETLDEQLEAAARDFFSRSWYLRALDEGKVGVSSILTWYREDFIKWLDQEKGGGQIRDFVVIYAPDPIREALENDAEIEFVEYDWRLTDQAAEWRDNERP